MTTASPPKHAGTALASLARWTGGELFIASAPAHASMAARQIVGRAAAPVRARVRGVDAGRLAAARSARTRSDLVVRARAGYMPGPGAAASATERRQSV